MPEEKSRWKKRHILGAAFNLKWRIKAQGTQILSYFCKIFLLSLRSLHWRFISISFRTHNFMKFAILLVRRKSFFDISSTRGICVTGTVLCENCVEKRTYLSVSPMKLLVPQFIWQTPRCNTQI